MAELEIPDRAYQAAYLGSSEGDMIDRAAPIIVAAELRRLAPGMLWTAASVLLNRADELDPLCGS